MYIGLGVGGKRVYFAKVFKPLFLIGNIGDKKMRGPQTQTPTPNPVRDGGKGGCPIPPELRLSELVSLKQNEYGEYYLEPNTELLIKYLDGMIDHYFDEEGQEFGVMDGFAGLYVTLVNRRDDVVIIEYHDEFVSMYKLARFNDIKDMVAVSSTEEGCYGVVTPNKDEFDIVSE